MLTSLPRSDAQGELLALLLLPLEAEYTLTEVARRVGQAATGHVLFRSLAELLELSYGPRAVLPDVFAGVAGVREAYLYGVGAEPRHGCPRANGSPGPGRRSPALVRLRSHAAAHHQQSGAGLARRRPAPDLVLPPNHWAATLRTGTAP